MTYIAPPYGCTIYTVPVCDSHDYSNSKGRKRRPSRRGKLKVRVNAVLFPGSVGLSIGTGTVGVGELVTAGRGNPGREEEEGKTVYMIVFIVE